MRGFGRCFRHLLEDWMCFTMHYTFRGSVGHICGRNFPKRKINRPQSCAKYFVQLLFYKLHPRNGHSCGYILPVQHCLPGGAFGFQFVFFVTLRGRRAVRSNGYTLSRFFCRRLVVEFDAVFSIFSEMIAVSVGLQVDSSHFFARWRHNYWEIAVKHCEKFKNRRKSLCAPLRIEKLRDFKNTFTQYFRARNVDMHLYKIFPLFARQLPPLQHALGQLHHFWAVVNKSNSG